MGGDTSDLIIFFIVVALRFIVPLFIPRFPLPAILLALVIDAADQTIFQQFTNLNLDGYQNYDKALDIFYLTVAFLAVYRNWTNSTAIVVARFLWYYRLLGVWLFEVFQERWLLMIFPNTFEYFFIAYELLRTQWDPRRLTRKVVYGIAAFIWIFIKLPQEWWIHVAQLDFTDFMKEDVFGTTTTTSWADAITNRPLVSIALAVRDRRTDRPRRVGRASSTDTRLVVPRRRRQAGTGHHDGAPPGTGWNVAAVLGEGAPHRSDRRDLRERAERRHHVVADCRCDAPARPRQCGISEALAKRGYEWSSIGLQFVVIVAFNSALLSIYASLLGDGLNRALTLTFGFVMTVVIVLYDRFRSDYLERTTTPSIS